MRYLKWKGIDARLDIPTIYMKQPEYLTMEQIEKLMSSCRTPLERAVITVLFDTAIRINELLNINLKDINFKDSMITVTRKGGRIEEVNISTKALNTIKEWLASRKCSSKKVFNIDYHTVWKLVKKVGSRNGINLHPHMLRHSRARHMLVMGTPPHIVQQHLGHRNIATTLNIYGKFTAGQIKKDIPEW
jgi:integrase